MNGSWFKSLKVGKRSRAYGKSGIGRAINKRVIGAIQGQGLYSGMGGYMSMYRNSKIGKRTKAYGKSGIGRAINKRVIGAIQGQGLYSGRGGYNALISGGPTVMMGKMKRDETGALTITNREYIKDIYGPGNTNFTDMSLPLNPGLQNSFPWLSQVAANYAEYELLQCVMEYRTLVDASNNTDGINGEIILTTQYNVSAPDFADKTSMLQNYGSQSGKATESHSHGIECDPRKNPGDGHKYIRTSPVQPDEDLKTYDHAKFELALNNVPDSYQNKVLGELWIYYTVRLHKPRLYVSRGLFNRSDYYRVCPQAQNVMPMMGEVTNGSSCLGPFTGTPTTNTLTNDSVLTSLLTGQQNTINCRIQPGPTGATRTFYIIFPDWYEGLVRIVIKTEGTGGIRATNPNGTLLNNGQINSTTGYNFTSFGQISPVYDIYAGTKGAPGGQYSTAPAWETSSFTVGPYTVAGGFALQNGYWCATAECHVNIKSATNGTDNYILVDYQNFVAQQAFDSMICIQEYSGKQTDESPDLNSRVTFVNAQNVIANVDNFTAQQTEWED